MSPQDVPSASGQLTLSGRYREALLLAIEGLACSRTDKERFDHAIQVCRVCRFLGDGNRGLMYVQLAQELAKNGLGRMAEVKAWHARAIIMRTRRDLPQAWESLEQALKLAKGFAPKDFQAVLWLERAEVAREMGREEEAIDAIARGAKLAKAVHSERLMAWALYMRSLYEKPLNACFMLNEALLISEKLDIPELRWQILFRLSQVEEQMGKPLIASHYLDDSTRTLENMAMRLPEEMRTSFFRVRPRSMPTVVKPTNSIPVNENLLKFLAGQ